MHFARSRYPLALLSALIVFSCKPTDWVDPGTGGDDGDPTPEIPVVVDGGIKLPGDPNRLFSTFIGYDIEGPNCLTVSDFNGDGCPDLAATYYYKTDNNGTDLKICLTNPDMSFKTTNITIGNGIHAGEIVCGDFNGDHASDIALTLDNTGVNVYVFPGKGNGEFQTPATYGVPGLAKRIGTGDFNGDGKKDLIVASTGTTAQFELTVFAGNGDGSFTDSGSFKITGAPLCIVTGDVNKDGREDAVVSLDSNNGQQVPRTVVLLGNGSGGFTAGAGYDGSDPGPLALHDFDKDGTPDLVIAQTSGDFVSVLGGNGDGTFGNRTDYHDFPGGPTGLSVGDFDGDGYADIAVATHASGSIRMLVGKGDGTFVPSARRFGAGSYEFSFASGGFQHRRKTRFCGGERHEP